MMIVGNSRGSCHGSSPEPVDRVSGLLPVQSLAPMRRFHTKSMARVYYFTSLKPQTARFSNNGSISFSDNASNPFDTQFGFANAIPGGFNTYQQASSHTTGNYKYFNLEWYVQDNWRITKRLTLDYGLRFVWMPPQYETTGKAVNFLLISSIRLKHPGFTDQFVSTV
jgi:TonB dependent receptor